MGSGPTADRSMFANSRRQRSPGLDEFDRSEVIEGRYHVFGGVSVLDEHHFPATQHDPHGGEGAATLRL